MLSLELTLTRAFALAEFYHFGFMVVSLALLGIAAAGSLLAVRRSLGDHPRAWSVCFSAAALTSLVGLNSVPFDSYAIAWDPRQLVYLTVTLACTSLPFLFAGLVVSGLLAAAPSRLHRVYGANMAGSAAGSLAAPLLVASLGVSGAVVAQGALGLGAAALIRPRRRESRRPDRRESRLRSKSTTTVLWVGALVAALAATSVPDALLVELSPYKALAQAMLAPDAMLADQRWTTAGRLDIVESSAIHVYPGLSQNAELQHPPRQAGLTIDGDNLTPITDLAPDDRVARHLAAHVPQALVAELRPDSDLVVLEPRGGWDVLMARAVGIAPVYVVERRREVIEAVHAYTAERGSLYESPAVVTAAVEPRTYLRRSGSTHGVILVALSDSFHPVTSGAYGLNEDYRYTVEAISDYLNALRPNGLLLITRWLQTPPTESLRVLASVSQALAGRGIDAPASHLAAIRSLRTITYVVGRDPLRAADIASIRDFASRLGYDLVWLPGMTAQEANIHNRLPQADYYHSVSELLDSPEAFVSSHAFDIRPPTDDRPFFNHYFRWSQTPDILAGLGRTWQPFGGSGYLVLVVLLAVLASLAAALISGPLLIRRVGTASPGVPPLLRLRTFAFFFALGLGYLFVLLPISQRFILFVGDAVTALAVVFFAVLLWSGIGSMTAPRWNPRLALIALVCGVAASPIALEILTEHALAWERSARLAATFPFLAPLGLLMGVPFAGGLAILEERAPGITPWAWAVNGTASVLSGVLAAMIAVAIGFGAVLYCGALSYAIALAAIWPFTSRTQ